MIVANFAVWLFYELPHLQSAVLHASFYPCTIDGSCHGAVPGSDGQGTGACRGAFTGALHHHRLEQLASSTREASSAWPHWS